jgi:hypothetical protein
VLGYNFKGFDWPPAFQQFAHALAFLNFDIFTAARIDCLLPRAKDTGLRTPGSLFMGELAATALTPLLICLFCLVYVPISRAFRTWKGKLLYIPAEERAQAAEQISCACWRMSLWVMVIAQAGVAGRVLRAFDCIDIEGTRWLRADLSLQCDSSEYAPIFGFGVICMVIYLVLIPGGIFFLLNRHRKPHEDAPKGRMFTLLSLRDRYGYLYSDYQYWWFELLEMFRKTWFIVGYGFISNGSTSIVVSAGILSFCYLLFVMEMRPYKNMWDNRLLSLTQISLFFTLLGGQMVKMGLADTENLSESFIDGILISINVAVVICTFSFGILETILKRRAQYKKMKETRRKNLANRLAVIDAEVEALTDVASNVMHGKKRAMRKKDKQESDLRQEDQVGRGRRPGAQHSNGNGKMGRRGGILASKKVIPSRLDDTWGDALPADDGIENTMGSPETSDEEGRVEAENIKLAVAMSGAGKTRRSKLMARMDKRRRSTDNRARRKTIAGAKARLSKVVPPGYIEDDMGDNRDFEHEKLKVRSMGRRRNTHSHRKMSKSERQNSKVQRRLEPDFATKSDKQAKLSRSERRLLREREAALAEKVAAEENGKKILAEVETKEAGLGDNDSEVDFDVLASDDETKLAPALDNEDDNDLTLFELSD